MVVVEVTHAHLENDCFGGLIEDCFRGCAGCRGGCDTAQ